MADCIFCKIVNGEIPAERVYDDKEVVAFLDIAPANKGHVLVVPKKHYDTFLEIQDKEINNLLVVTKKIAKAVEKATNAEGINILINNREIAGQLVKHAHIHIIPRFSGDEINFGWKQKKYEGNEMKNRGDKIRKEIE